MVIFLFIAINLTDTDSFYNLASCQERKKAVKAEAKERRKHKMPKAEKKRAIKKGK
jgi:hypothetical protein